MSSSSSPQGRYATAASSTTTKRGRAPASDKAILGLRQISAADYDFSSGECAICLQDFDFGPAEEKETPQLRALPCSHAFHQHCIFRWLRCNAICPLCRYQLPTEESEDDEERRVRRRMTEWEFSLIHPADFIDAAIEPGTITEQVQEYEIYEQVDAEEMRRIINETYNNFLQLLNRQQN